jgi:2,3-bisphosphoglycerate-dependent phosphoglycerate mutase
MTYHADRPFTLYFVRHGVTEVNFKGLRCGGDLDVPLMDVGCDQAYLLAKQISRMELDIGLIGSSARARPPRSSAACSEMFQLK